jgi:FlaA1/EpsC-like NDP-sugar epimerase
VPRLLLLTSGYALLLQLAFVLSLAIRYEGDVPGPLWRAYLQVTLFFTVLSLAGFFVVGLYHGLWRYASTVTLFQILKGVTLSAASLLLIALFGGQAVLPLSLIVLVWLWELVLMGGARLAWRLWREQALGPLPLRAARALVVGAGPAGMHLAEEMRRGTARQEVLEPAGFIDENLRLKGRLIEGVEVLGAIADLPRALREQQAEVVIVSDPDLPAKVVREIARVCAEAGVRVKTLPGLSDLHPGRTALSQVRDVSIEDLLGRLPVELDLSEVAGFLRGRRVLVTGAGGARPAGSRGERALLRARRAVGPPSGASRARGDGRHPRP